MSRATGGAKQRRGSDERSGPVLRSISPEATPEEVAAVVAAIAELTRAQAVAPEESDDALQEWVRTARVASRRSGLQRGPWRLSGRIGRRSRS